MYARFTICTLTSSFTKNMMSEQLKKLICVTGVHENSSLVLALRLKRKYCFNNSRTS